MNYPGCFAILGRLTTAPLKRSIIVEILESYDHSIDDLSSELYKALVIPEMSMIHLQAFFLDLMWMFDEDPKGVLKEKYSATREQMAEAIHEELSDFLRDAEMLISKAYSLNPKIMSVQLEFPDTIRLEMILR